MSGWYYNSYPFSNTTAGSTITSTTFYSTFTYWNPTIYIECPSIPETDEQRQDREQRQVEYQRQQAEIGKQRKEADNRARELLKQHIGLDAFGKLHEVGYIEVDSQHHKGRKYRIHKNAYERIDVLDEQGKVIDRLCIVRAIQCPDDDLILTKKVLLESVEEYALQVANHFRP